MRNLLYPEVFLDNSWDIAFEGSNVDFAAKHPRNPRPWARLALEARMQGKTIKSYAFARCGYHRSLDALRASGWKGAGPVPIDHIPNQSYYLCLYELYEACKAIGENDEVKRLKSLIDDGDEIAFKKLENGEIAY